MTVCRLGRISQVPTDISETVKILASSNEGERGAIFTRREVVEFILDLAGYTPDQPLYKFKLLEPSFGEGDFLLPVAERLLQAWKSQARKGADRIGELSNSIRAVEVHPASIKTTRAKLNDLFSRYGVPAAAASRLMDAWIIEGDFLLVDLPHKFTHAVGNPPYVRQELIPDDLLSVYRSLFSTMYDRADLYVPFLERCLSSLDPGGVLGFICADRWMKNKYGGPLRGMVASGYHLVCYVDMYGTPAFHSDVIAYPAITIIKREKPGSTRIAHRPEINSATLSELARDLQAETIPEGSRVVEIEDVAKEREPWILQSFDQLKVVRRLEAEFPSIEEAGCKVGIGVATGADKVYIGPMDQLDVEPDRKLPLAKTKDIQKGVVDWQGHGVINPYEENGALVNLENYPRLAAYFKTHSKVLRKRNCAQNNPSRWYKTIDRIYPGLTSRPKLLIPDIKGKANVVYEEGRLYPHHNLYFITSEEWNLRALQAVLLSGIAKLFVSTYSTRMHGGFLRFQAQYLRRIRIPKWEDVPDGVRQALMSAAEAGDMEACNRATFDLYRLSPEERSAIGGNGN